MPDGRTCSFLIPGDWHTPTGGFAYDRRLVRALRAAGWAVDSHRLDADWPWPDTAAVAAARARIEALAEGTIVVADGLAFGALPDLVQGQAWRLRWVALVHHPLHLESGLEVAVRERLRDSETRALRFASQVIVTSARSAHDVAALGVETERIAVVEPGTDAVPAHLTPAATRTRHTRDPLRLLCVATLTPRKGHAVLLQALAGLVGRGRSGIHGGADGTAGAGHDGDWELHCVGSATREPHTAARLHAMSEAPALAGRVVWHGEVDAAALQAHYAAADLFVLPSLHEGYGMAVAEALAWGLPVVSSDAGALVDTVPPGAGLRVPVGDAAALGDALAALIVDPALRARLAAGAHAAAQRLPSWERQAARFGAVLEGLA